MLKIVIPYRDRPEHLDIFRKTIDFTFDVTRYSYKINIVEQFNDDPFWITKLIDIGFDLFKPFSSCECKLGGLCSAYDSFLFWPIDHWFCSGFNYFHAEKNQLKLFWPEIPNRIETLLPYFDNPLFSQGFKAFSCCPNLYEEIGGQPHNVRYGGDDLVFTKRAIKKVGMENVVVEPVSCLYDTKNILSKKESKDPQHRGKDDWVKEGEKDTWDNNLLNLDYKIVERKEYTQHISHIKVDW